jgi:hypothetical protein
VFRIGESQSGQAAKAKDIADSVEPVVGQRFADKRIEFCFGQRHLDVGLVDLHLVIPERILFDPLVADSVEDEVFQTTQQIHSTVVLTLMRRLHERIQSVDILVGNGIQRQIILLVLLLRVFGHITQQTVIFVRCQLGNPHTDLFLPLVAVFGELGEEHSRVARCMLQPLFDSETIGILTLLDDAIVSGEDIGPTRSDDFIDPH